MKNLLPLLVLSIAAAPGLPAQPIIEHAPDGWAFPAEDDPFTAEAALDLGKLLNEPIAGETGHIRLSEDGESFVRGDGKPIRFWGVVSEGWKMSPDDMERHAKWLAKRGVNIARVHANLSVNTEGAKITDVNKEE
ncbi:MAG: hypothetical protein N2322_02835, partial [Terrimicrobiaceae bacterium]|nr:hypothetical protein [Terrimicrobiaceae bacterium]